MPFLGLISDVLLLAATLGMAFYCRLLSGRLRAFNDLDNGIGGTIAALSLQVDEMKASIEAVHIETDGHSDRLRAQIMAADDRIGRLEVLLAGLEDIEAEAAVRIDNIEHDLEPIAIPAFRPSRPANEGEFTR